MLLWVRHQISHHEVHKQLPHGPTLLQGTCLCWWAGFHRGHSSSRQPHRHCLNCGYLLSEDSKLASTPPIEEAAGVPCLWMGERWWAILWYLLDGRVPAQEAELPLPRKYCSSGQTDPCRNNTPWMSKLHDRQVRGALAHVLRTGRENSLRDMKAKLLPSSWACCMNIPITELIFFTAVGNPSFKPNWPSRPEETKYNICRLH